MTILTGSRRLMAAVACLLGLCITVQGCGGGNVPPASTGTADGREASGAGPSAGNGQLVAIAFRSEPDPPAAGDNTFEVVVTQPDGSPVTDATVEAVFSMPAMPASRTPPRPSRDRKSTRLNSSHLKLSRMPSSA